METKISETITLFQGDCLEIMKLIPNKSIDLILTDPPYGTTTCKWDTVIPLDIMWEELKRIRKDTTPILLFGCEPFSSTLRMSNIKEYRYDWIWEKEKGSIPMTAPFKPICVTENIHAFCMRGAVFNKVGMMKYYPIMVPGKPYKGGKKKEAHMKWHSFLTHDFKDNQGTRYPKNVLKFNTQRGLHPTQKPVDLLEYLIKTYTIEGETILDFTMGSGSTGVACKNLNRRFIGIEKDLTYYETAIKRITETI